jgi:hypothetical protein
MLRCPRLRNLVSPVKPDVILPGDRNARSLNHLDDRVAIQAVIENWRDPCCTCVAGTRAYKPVARLPLDSLG